MAENWRAIQPAGNEEQRNWLEGTLLCSVAINFMCQFNWNTGWSDIWSNIILGVSMRVFLEESVDRVKKVALPNVGGVIQLAEGLNRTKMLTLPRVTEISEES